MGPFTSWLDKWRKNNDLPLSPELAEKLAAEVFEVVERVLRRRMTAGFGTPDAADLIADQVVVFLERLSDSERLLPAFVTDSKSLFVWMYREVWSRFCRTLSRDRPSIRGFSAFPKSSEGAIELLGMENMDAVEPYVGKLDADTDAIFGRAMDDLREWQGPEWVMAFEAVYLNGQSQREVAKSQGVSEGTISRRLNQGKFCLARQLRWTQSQLVEGFGEEDARRWGAALEAKRLDGNKR